MFHNCAGRSGQSRAPSNEERAFEVITERPSGIATPTILGTELTQLLSLYKAVLYRSTDALTGLLLVAVITCAIEQPVPCLDGFVYGLKRGRFDDMMDQAWS